MKINILRIFTVALVLSSWIGAVEAATPYTEKEFRKALESGSTVLLDFHAPWCSTCRAQGRSLESIEAKESHKDLQIFTVDYDEARDLKAAYKVKKQSTLILFKNGKEVDRSIGVSDIAGLSSFLNHPAGM